MVHDLNGNRRATGTANSVIDTNNRLTGDGTYTYQYDKDGNRTKRTKTSDGSYTDYVYDQRHRLTSATTKNVGGTLQRQADFTYDAFDRLVKRVIDLDGAGVGAATTEYFAYDGHDVALTFDASGNLTKRYLNGPAADQVLAEEQLSSGVAVTHADRTFWALSDNAGTVRDVYNSVGALKNHLTIDAFGNVKNETASSVDFLYGFQGLLRDEATGLYLSQTRWLDPLTGKWLQEDWIGFAGGDANLARFVGNSPANYVDPSGEEGWWNPMNWYDAEWWGAPPTETLTAPPIGLPPVATDQNPPEEESAPNNNPARRKKVSDVDLSWGDVWDVFKPINIYWGAAEKAGDALIVASGTLFEGLGLDQAIREIQVRIAMRHLDTQIGMDYFNASRKLGSAELWAAQKLAEFAVTFNITRFCELMGGGISSGWRAWEQGCSAACTPGASVLPPSGSQPPVLNPPPPPPLPPKPPGVAPQPPPPSKPAAPRTPPRQRRAARPQPPPVQVQAPQPPQPQVVNVPTGGGGGKKGGLIVKQGGSNAPATPTAQTKSNGPKGFSTPKFGNDVHGKFQKALMDQTGTRRDDWYMRTKPGQTGVDATYVGPKSRYPGFKYAELKPYSQNGYNTFQRQMDNWGLPQGETQLFFYDQGGIIGSSGINY